MRIEAEKTSIILSFSFFSVWVFFEEIFEEKQRNKNKQKHKKDRSADVKKAETSLILPTL